MINETKAASPFSLEAPKAASILPPTPCSISATERVPADATLSLALERMGLLALLMDWELCVTLPNVEAGLDKVEKARVEDAMQPNQRVKEGTTSDDDGEWKDEAVAVQSKSS